MEVTPFLPPEYTAEELRNCESRRQIGPQKRSDFLIVAD